MRSTICRKLGRALLPAAFWLWVWQLASMAVAREAVEAAFAAGVRTGDYAALLGVLARGRAFLLPAPAAVFATLRDLVAAPLFWRTTGATLLRIFGGFAAGVALGAAIAVLTTASRRADLLLAPAVRVVRATPVASFIILVLLWVRTGRVPAVISALMVLPVVWGSVSAGIRQTDPQLLELASAYRFGRGKTLRIVYLPSVLPYFASGCRTALGLAWKAGVAAEVLCLPPLAVGTQVYYSKIYLETPALFAWTLAVIALSFLVEWGLGAAFRRMGEGRRAL